MRWVVDAVAVYRVSRLITTDGITAELRDAVVEWTHTGPDSLLKRKVEELIECRWCVSLWVALALVYVVRRRRWWPDLADALAFSALAALAARLEEE